MPVFCQLGLKAWKGERRTVPSSNSDDITQVAVLENGASVVAP
jgi:hypothetical protein